MHVERLDQWIITRLAAMCRKEESAISGKTRLVDLGLDSLGRGLLIAQMEAELSCELEPQQLMQALRAVSVSGLIAAVREAVTRSDRTSGGT